MFVIHQHGIVHRDIKPENILFFAPARGSMSGRGGRFATVKLCDFGCAFQLDANFDPTASANLLTQAQMKSMVGSSYYVAPEVLRQDSNYTAAVDLWSLGVITFLLVLGFPPFDGDSEVRRVRNDISAYDVCNCILWAHLQALYCVIILIPLGVCFVLISWI